MSRTTFDNLLECPDRIYDMDRAALVTALTWNDPNGDYNEPQDEPGYMTIDQLCVALLIQVVNSR